MTDRGSLLPHMLLSGSLLAMAAAPLGGGPGVVLDRLRDEGRNRADLDRLERGYYEHLLSVGPRVEARLAPPSPPPFKDGPLAVGVADYRECVLEPNVNHTYAHGRWTNNSLGLRDREYPLVRPRNAFRAVLLGDSIGVGWGVDDGRGFEPLLELALDEESRSRGGPTIEILNLSVPGYAPGQRVEHLSRLGWSLQPNLVIYEATTADLAWDERRLRVLLPQGMGTDVPMFRPVLERAGLGRGSDTAIVASRLKPLRAEITRAVYNHLAAEARRHCVPVVWILVPRVGRPIDSADHAQLLALAREAGFAVVIDLSDAFAGLPVESLAVDSDDYHPNALGHARLANRLREALMERTAASSLEWPFDVPGEPLSSSERSATR